MVTAGIDIGSATSHFLLSRLELQRLTDSPSSRYVTTAREILYKSPILLTPYTDSYQLIDGEKLGSFVAQSYIDSGVNQRDVDSGVVILTGEAVRRRNARIVTETLADFAGDFICAAAGPKLEAEIAAHGSGAVALSRNTSGTVMNVDIGGGSTKFSVVEDGYLVSSAAISVGGRTMVVEEGVLTRLENSAAGICRQNGIVCTLGSEIDSSHIRRVTESMAEIIVSVMRGVPINQAQDWLWITAPLHLQQEPDYFVFSGGVADFVLGSTRADYDDLGRPLGGAIRRRLESAGVSKRVLKPTATGQATVLGASQYTVRVSGSTVGVDDPSVLPLRSLRVVSPGRSALQGELHGKAIGDAIRSRFEEHDIDRNSRLWAIALKWKGRPSHARLKALAEGILAAVRDVVGPREGPVVLLFDADIGRTMGHMLQEELASPFQVICLDGISVDEFDFVDIGGRIEPSGTYPVIVKSLVFPSDVDENKAFHSTVR